MKRFFFLVFAAIAVITALTSCDKDELIISDPQPIFFRIMDATHIDLYDQGENVYEAGREVEFKIAPQMVQYRLQTTPLQPLEDLDIEIDPYEKERYSSILDVKVKFNHFTNNLKIYGLHIEGKDALGNDIYVICLNRVFLRGEIIVERTQETPFLQAGRIHYTLYIIKQEEELVLAEADQEFVICEDVNDIDY